MRLKEALSVLSKSSPYSVSTLRTGNPDSQLLAKEYLYVPSQIDADFEAALRNSSLGDLLFLCGSSGDGKSEILTRLCRENNNTSIRFHLDATHSKTQHGSAINCLDNLFDEYEQEGFTLAIGINIGMMQKFIKFGAERHIGIKKFLNDFLENRNLKGFRSGKSSFFDFESYPRIDFSYGSISSGFVTQFLDNLTRESESNPFWKAYKEDEKYGLVEAKNYKLLSDKRIQKAIIELLGLIRLHDEQFLVPRIFVDFIYKLVVTNHDDGLIGNLFTSLDNEISEKILSHDPVNFRSEELDDYFLARATNTLCPVTVENLNYLDDFSGLRLSSFGSVRLASILSETVLKEFPDSYLAKIPSIFSSKSYIELHGILIKNEISDREEDTLISVLENFFISAVIKYINRQVSKDITGYVLSRNVKDFFIYNKVEIALDLDAIVKMTQIVPEFIKVPFIVNETYKVLLDLDIKLLSLVEKIDDGFLPNRNLLNEHAKLDEFIRDIVSASSKSEEIKVYRKDDLELLYAEVREGRRGYTLKGVCSVN